MKTVMKKTKNYATLASKIKIDISLDILDLLFTYTLDTNGELTNKKSQRNIQAFLNILDEDAYLEKPDEMAYINIIKFLIDRIIEDNVVIPEILRQMFLDELPEYKDFVDLFDNVINDIYDGFAPISMEEVRYINKFIEERLMYYNIFRCRDMLSPIFKKLDGENKLSALNTSYTSIIEKMFSDCMKVKADQESILDDFDMHDDTNVDIILDKTIQEYNKPNNRLNMGVQLFNEMLGGGLENGRFYLACGIPKSWKSGILLNMVIWAIKYNVDFDLKDNSKIPTVLYVTQENSTKETINRVYINLTGKSIKHLSLDEAKKVLNEELRDNYKVNLLIKYRANKTISTLDFDNMIGEAESNGYEIVLAVQDYTKRIRSANFNSEIRLELANVADDFCSIAKRRNIPIVSGAQLNREAYREVERAIAKGKKDIAKELNSSHIGESVGLIENADCSFIINRETIDGADEEYLSFKLIASREKDPKVTYFAQKFINGMKIEEDFGLAQSLSYSDITQGALENFDPSGLGGEPRKLTGKIPSTVSNRRSTKRTGINPASADNIKDTDTSMLEDDMDDMEFEEDV